MGIVEWLLAWPSLPKLATVLAFMLVLVRVRLNVGWALCIGAALCGLWFRQTPRAMAGAVGDALQAPNYVALVLMILVVLVLNHTLQQSGQIDRIVAAFFRISRRPRTTLVFFPALLGLLPMPGGALFSAPMVEATGNPLGVDPRSKTLINYWFRHIWEYSWPLYPGIILAAQMSGYRIETICLVQLPLVAVVAAAGWWSFVRPLEFAPPEQQTVGQRRPRGAVWGFLREVSPIWLVIVLFAALRGAHAVAADHLGEGAVAVWLKHFPIVIAVTLTTLYTWAANRMGLREIGRVLWQKDMLQNLIIALGIIVFAGVLAGSGAAEQVAAELKASAIPLPLVAMVLPLAVGAITGITMNMVALTYPVILAALNTPELRPEMLGYMALAFAFGYGGILLTPVHICMVQSNHYFKLSATATMHRLAMPVLCLLVAGLVLFALYVYVLPQMGLIGPPSGPTLP